MRRSALKVTATGVSRNRAARPAAGTAANGTWCGNSATPRLCALAHRLQTGGMTWLADLIRDFRYAARSLARTPSFTVVAVMVLALGIGATSAIFSLVSAVWLKPLPFADAERIVSIWVDLTATGGPDDVNVSPGHYADWQERARSFESMSPISPVTLNLTGDGGEPERLTGIRSSESLFETIGLPPLLGRTFAPGDPAVNAIVASEGFWLGRLVATPRPSVARSLSMEPPM